MKKTHIDCKHYLAIDVFKGICKRDKNNILADDSSCEHFSQIPKCAHCSNYLPINEQLGKCKNDYDAYADMPAKTCAEFAWKEQVN